MALGDTDDRRHSLDQALAGLRAAAEPTRLRILALCGQAELSVSELVAILGQSQPRVSRHLKVLTEGGLLERLPEGNCVFFRLAHEGAVPSALPTVLEKLSGDGTLAIDRTRLDAVKAARAKRAAEYFSANARRWDEIRSLYVDEARVEEAVLDLLPKGTIGDYLDIGTGTGRLLEVVAPRVERGVGIDLSREMLAVARANLERAHINHCYVRHGNMYHLPWPAASFDLITIHQVLHFADTPAAVIAEAARVLRPGGLLVVVDFAPHDLEFLRTEQAHRRLGFSDRELRTWFRAAGLRPARLVSLKGKPLTVTVATAVALAGARAPEQVLEVAR